METVTLDSRGRSTLPRGIREQMHLQPGDRFTVELEGGVLRIARALPTDRAGRAAWFARAIAQDNAYLEAHPEEVAAIHEAAAAWDATLLDGLRDEPPYDEPRVQAAMRGSAAGQAPGQRVCGDHPSVRRTR